MIKTIKKFQIKLTPFDATKTWYLSTVNNEDLLLHDTGSYTDPEVPVALEFIDYDGIGGLPSVNSECNIALEQQDDDLANTRLGLKKSGLFFPEIDPQNEDGTYKRVVYSQVNTMFYNNSKNPTQTWGINNIDFTLSKTKRRISDEFRLFDVPQNIYGDKIIPNTVTLHDYSFDIEFDITDDGYGNLMAGTNLFSKFQEIGDFTNTFISGSSPFCDSYWYPIYGYPEIPISGSSASFDYGNVNLGFFAGSTDSFPVGDSLSIAASFQTGSLILSAIESFAPETSSVNIIFLSGSIFDTITTSSGLDSSSVNIIFLSGSIFDAVYTSSVSQTSSVQLLFYSSSIYTYAIPTTAAETMNMNIGFNSGSIA